MKKYLVLLMILLLACSTQQPPQKEYLTHTVKYQGETLGKIAAWYTGSSSNWTLIQQENPDLNVNKIKPGSTIRIPQDLVTKTEPLPKKYINSTKNKKEIITEKIQQASETNDAVIAQPSVEPTDVAVPVAPNNEIPVVEVSPVLSEEAQMFPIETPVVDVSPIVQPTVAVPSDVVVAATPIVSPSTSFGEINF